MWKRTGTLLNRTYPLFLPNFIKNLNFDKEVLRKEIGNGLNIGKLRLSSIKHPIYLNLKEKLFDLNGQNKEDRQQIPKTAYELLEIYWSK